MTPKQMTRRGEKHDDDNDNDHRTNSQNAHHQIALSTYFAKTR